MYSTAIIYVTLVVVLVGVATESTSAYIYGIKVINPMRIVGSRKITVQFMN